MTKEERNEIIDNQIRLEIDLRNKVTIQLEDFLEFVEANNLYLNLLEDESSDYKQRAEALERIVKGLCSSCIYCVGFGGVNERGNRIDTDKCKGCIDITTTISDKDKFSNWQFAYERFKEAE